MKSYIYKFADGTTSTVMVDDDLYNKLKEEDEGEERNNRAETRRHILMSYLQENGIEIEDVNADTDKALSDIERRDRLNEALSKLTEQQRELLFLVRIDGVLQTELAEQMGITPRALNNRIKRILRKLKKFL